MDFGDSIDENQAYVRGTYSYICCLHNSISKEIDCAKHEYMNMSPSLIELATQLHESFNNSKIKT